MPLTDTQIRAAKPGTKTIKLSDGGGLQLWIEPHGAKLWRLAYRFDGKQKKLAIGSYPGIGLKEAREKRTTAKSLLASGTDPGQQKRADRAVQANLNATTFQLIAEELIAKAEREERSIRTLDKARWLLFDLACPALGTRPIATITAAEVLAVLREVEKRGRLETAKRLRGTIGQVFRFAIATGRCSTDPTQALHGALTAPTVKHRAAILEPVAFGGLLRAIWAYEGQPETKAALQLMALLHPRPGELRQAEWSEFDLEAATWTIPASRTKMRREHKTPLPQQALDILKGLRSLTGNRKLAFPGLRSPTRPISENTLNAALRRLGYSKDEATSHGFRATFSTLANESGRWSIDAIERHLAHQDADAVRRAYARGAHWNEREALCQWWGDYVDTLRKGADVVPFGRKEGGL